jgi:hypothetical protein
VWTWLQQLIHCCCWYVLHRLVHETLPCRVKLRSAEVHVQKGAASLHPEHASICAIALAAAPPPLNPPSPLPRTRHQEHSQHSRLGVQ